MFSAPSAPTIIPEECSAENNSVTVAWQPPPQSHVEGYVLELDDGNGGDFRVRYKFNFYDFPTQMKYQYFEKNIWNLLKILQLRCEIITVLFPFLTFCQLKGNDFSRKKICNVLNQQKKIEHFISNQTN